MDIKLADWELGCGRDDERFIVQIKLHTKSSVKIAVKGFLHVCMLPKHSLAEKF